MRHKNKNELYYHINIVGYREILKKVKKIEKPFFEENEYYDVIEVFETIYKINNDFLNRKNKIEIIKETEITVHNISTSNSNVMTLFQSVYFLYYIQYIEIDDFYSFYFSKHIFSYFFNKNLNYTGIKLSMYPGRGGIQFELYFDLSKKTIMVDQNQIVYFRKIINYIQNQLGKNVNVRQIYIRVDFDYSKKNNISEYIKKLFYKAPMTSFTVNYYNNNERKHDVEYNTSNNQDVFSLPDCEHVSSAGRKLQLCVCNFGIVSIIPYWCNFYSDYNVKAKCSDNKELERYINNVRKTVR